jgi:hypothetical protein
LPKRPVLVFRMAHPVMISPVDQLQRVGHLFLSLERSKRSTELEPNSLVSALRNESLQRIRDRSPTGAESLAEANRNDPMRQDQLPRYADQAAQVETVVRRTHCPSTKDLK